MRAARVRLARRRRVLVACGGRTESLYIGGLWRRRGDPSVALTVKVRAQAPTQLVDYARRLVDHNNADFDEIWRVIGADQFDVDSAVVKALQSRVHLAVSLRRMWGHASRTSRSGCKAERHMPAYHKARISF
jgi:hypothetical protein